MAQYQIEPKKKKKRKGKALLTVFVVLLLMAIAATAGFMIGSSMIKPPEIKNPFSGNNSKSEAEEERVDGVYNVLIVGTDKVALNTDTILVASLDSKNNKINILSIPRDTMSNVSRTVKKINSAYAVGAEDGKGNIENLKKEVQYLTGFEVDNYVVVNLSAFEELIDAIGGVKIDVPRNMNYDDPYQNLHIHISAGEQVLNGKQAVGFCRYRSGYAEGDLGRVKAQQLFIKALIKQVATPTILPKIPELAQIILENMNTDLSAGEMLWFAKQAMEVDLENDLQTFILPGEARYVYSLSYYIPDKTAVMEMMNAYFNPYEEELMKDKFNMVDVLSLPKEKTPQKVEENKSEEKSETNAETNTGSVGKETEIAENDNKPSENTEISEDTNQGEDESAKNEAGNSSGVVVPGEVLKEDGPISATESEESQSEQSAPKEQNVVENNENTAPNEVLKADKE